jgi:hypothetical protein
MQEERKACDKFQRLLENESGKGGRVPRESHAFFFGRGRDAGRRTPDAYCLTQEPRPYLPRLPTQRQGRPATPQSRQCTLPTLMHATGAARVALLAGALAAIGQLGAVRELKQISASCLREHREFRVPSAGLLQAFCSVVLSTHFVLTTARTPPPPTALEPLSDAKQAR